MQVSGNTQSIYNTYTKNSLEFDPDPPYEPTLNTILQVRVVIKWYMGNIIWATRALRIGIQHVNLEL